MTSSLRQKVWRIVIWVSAGAVGIYAFSWVVIFIFALIVHQQRTETAAVNGICAQRIWQNNLTVLTWNLGYAGTGAEADFIMDGGRDVWAKDKYTVLLHLGHIIQVLRKYSPDVYFLQEVDSGSQRTYRVDEADLIENGVNRYCYSYALNHDVPFIPYPYTRPLGRVRSGLLSLTVYKADAATRYQLPGSFSWPDSAFHLQRCLLASRLPREDGRAWVVINVHLEAWDNGEIKKKELIYLRDLALREYEEGNYVVIGGDWNSVMPGVRIDQFPTKGQPNAHTMKLPENLFPRDWRWGVALSHPSSRRCNSPYRPGQTYVTIIDGFLVSPNVQIDSVQGVPLDFQDSDHEPVEIRVHGS